MPTFMSKIEAATLMGDSYNEQAEKRRSEGSAHMISQTSTKQAVEIADSEQIITEEVK